ncbi:hypothetical protein MIMGU_mgv1a002457mg [Erythranthe guttata]|uniref:Uncharacterized protein n=1 Tax=Erythranthe guttata TaxID=4155 RepID=A0A022RYQ9_ERYGU|nr:hypothetical protein MIMGU_mgv1a002457mg [Erythranthe guttata]
MELRVCGASHYIQTIRGGVVMKVQNINSNGRPVIRTKSLKDIYKHEDAKTPQRPPSSLAIDHEQVKRENPWADRTLQDVKPKTDEFVPHADDNGDSGSDDDITLKQLRNRFLTKKRKHILSNEYSKKDSADCEPVEDESDLDVLIINLKPKRSKTSKAKRKRMNMSVASSPAIDFAVKSQENLVSEPICVKVEVPDTEELGSQIKASCGDPSSNYEGLNPGGLASNEFQEMVQDEYRETLLCADEHQNCVTDEIQYDHLEDIEPISMIVPWVEMCVKLESVELVFEEFAELPPSATEEQKETADADSYMRSLSEDHNSDMCSPSRSSFIMEDTSEQRSSSSIQVPDMDIDCIDGCKELDQESNTALLQNKAEAEFPNELDDYLSSLTKNCHSNPDSIISLTTNENLVPMEDTDEEQPPTCSFDPTDRNVLNCENELLKTKQMQISASPIADTESQYLSKNQTCDSADEISTSEPHQTPERLHSTRKVSQRKFVRSPRSITKKSQVAKGNFESSRFSRTLPNLSTGCTSVEGCSESAIAFSQRQMHDMESLSMKLMSELKSMKDIVEQKLLFEAYRNVSLKNDADEVKLAISNATKVEGTAKKWLSIMARDCNRFCKIMELTPNKAAISNDTVPREGRKIIFADEAGEKLCHVKFFENDSTSSPVLSDAEQQ